MVFECKFTAIESEEIIVQAPHRYCDYIGLIDGSNGKELLLLQFHDEYKTRIAVSQEVFDLHFKDVE